MNMPYCFACVSHLISMVSEEYKVSLIVESDNLTTFELRIMREERRKHPAYSLTESCVKVVQYYLWYVRTGIV